MSRSSVLALGLASRLKLVVQASGDMSGRSRGEDHMTSGENHPNILRELYERMTAEKRRRGPVQRAKNDLRRQPEVAREPATTSGDTTVRVGPQQLCDSCLGACGVAAS